MSGRAMVTGATGMLGSYIVEELIREGWTVTALVRDLEASRWLEELGARLAQGDLAAPTSLQRAARGCDIIVHAAAAIGAGGRWEAFYKGNVQGTKNVVDAAARSSARLVHVSSTAVLGSSRWRCIPTDESVPLPPLPAHDVYGRSKQVAEQLVLNAWRSGRISAAVVRPPVMYGIRDRQFAPRIGPVLSRGFFPLLEGGTSTLTLVYAGNVARGAVLAGTCPSADGRVYHLTNDWPVDTRLLVEAARAGLGTSIRAPVIPGWAARLGFVGLGLALRLAGRVDLARHGDGMLAMLTRDNPFTSQRARDELGWSFEGTARPHLEETFRWWKHGPPAAAPAVGAGRGV